MLGATEPRCAGCVEGETGKRFSVVGALFGGAGGALVAGPGGPDRDESHPDKVCGVVCCVETHAGTGFLT
jgi:hypothetical protein